MFIDASAIVAMMTNEREAGSLSARLATTKSRMTSAMALWEASVAYGRISGLEPSATLQEVESYIRPLQIDVIAIAPATATAAIVPINIMVRAVTPPPSISATASPMPVPGSSTCRSSARAMISPRPTSVPHDGRPRRPGQSPYGQATAPMQRYFISR
ncbi:type II toxin-antitoxin system VapC family toxin [Rhizobium sp. TRM95111]|nr:type II toxin-antitoxin system VapC family toxin [Rhizobium alarense]MCF3640238.1 type II toxin-antitoxin system VapC family toxin [Rhizobium alarense]